MFPDYTIFECMISIKSNWYKKMLRVLTLNEKELNNAVNSPISTNNKYRTLRYKVDAVVKLQTQLKESKTERRKRVPSARKEHPLQFFYIAQVSESRYGTNSVYYLSSYKRSTDAGDTDRLTQSLNYIKLYNSYDSALEDFNYRYNKHNDKYLRSITKICKIEY
jgi:hypothetical protein